MGQKHHKKLRRTARLMADMKMKFVESGKTPLVPPEKTHYRDSDGQMKNNPITERGTIRWLKKNAKRSGS